MAAGDPGTEGRSRGADPARVGTRDLASDLRAAVRGEVRFDASSRALYGSDASNYRVPPLGVVLPRDVQDVAAAVRVARAHDAPVTGRGGGTSLAGQACNHAVVLDFSKYMNRVLEVDPQARWARVQPGVVLDDLQAAAGEHGLMFGPDPATHSRCTLGGMIGNNSCGAHSVMAALYGPGALTEHHVLELTVLTYDGHVFTVGPTDDAALQTILAGDGARSRIYHQLVALRDRYGPLVRERYPQIPRRVSGYNLHALLPENGFDVARALVGTEGTCATVLEARVRLMPGIGERALLVIGYRDIVEAADHVPEILVHRPIAFEGIDRRLTEFMRRKGLHVPELDRLPAGGGWLLVEFGGDTAELAESRARALQQELASSPAPPTDAVLHTDPATMARIWKVRESGLGATAFVPGLAPAWPGWEDAAVAPEHLGAYLRDFRRLLDRYGYDASLYGHFGQGCIHTRINFDLATRSGLDQYLAFISDAAELVVHYNGSLSGEHGDGRARAHLLSTMYGPELVEAFREFKAIWDPAGRMNPGRVVDPDPPDADLRMGPQYHPPPLQTRFAFLVDGGSFAAAVDRCVGVGLCRRRSGGTMCPSYQVTGEETHSTRGRARLLQELVRGEVIRDGWRSDEVKEALDLCLSCKACKSECPVDVDVATYKAEFLSHYYAGRLRPRTAYALGLIGVWSRVARLAPGLANAVTRAPGTGVVLKWAAGVHSDRTLPRFARSTLKRWFRERGGATGQGERVILWPDTFTDHFRPDVGQAAVEVLEALGFAPVLPGAGLCCGRPLYDHGFLGLARIQLRRIVSVLRSEIRQGTAVIGLEPSCVATFRDELVNLFPDDPDAQRLSRQTLLLTEFLDRRGELELGGLPGERALVHGHCHHKAVLDFQAQQRILERMGVQYSVLDAGCCGMAGAFGFADSSFDVAQRCAERALLPAIRDADPRTLILTDGFSCQEMVRQNGLPRPLHSAQLLHMGLQRSGRLELGSTPGPPEAAAPGWGALAVAAATAYGGYRAGRALFRP